MEKEKFAIYELGIVQTLIRSMYGNLVYFLEITTLTQFFKKSVELLGCYRNCHIFSLQHTYFHLSLSDRTLSSIRCNCMGSSKPSQLNKRLVLQERALRFIHFAKPRDYAIPLFINTKILPINFLYYQLLAETMSDLRNNLVPTNIQELFLPLSRIQSYGTRSSTSQNFYVKKWNLEIK